MVALILAVVRGSDLNAVARTSVAPQQIGVEQRLEAEKRLWELAYWAGPIDGTFDSASRHALVAFQKIEGRTRNGNLTWTALKAYRFSLPLETGRIRLTVPLSSSELTTSANRDVERIVWCNIGQILRLRSKNRCGRRET